MTGPGDDQRLLLGEILSKLAAIPDQAALIRFMTQVLRSLLRRQGDSEFLATIQDAFTSGIAGHPWPEQKALAAEVITVVITKRPEIATAWQAQHGPGAKPPAQAPHRRAADQAPPEAPPSVPPPVMAETPDPYDFSEAEKRLGSYVIDILTRRLEVLRVKTPAPPSIAFCHSRPFFLFASAFPAVLADFVTGPLMKDCRGALERRVYRAGDAAVLGDEDAWKAFMADKRDGVWKVLLSRLSKLATAQKTAEAKLAATKLGIDAAHQYKMVEMPVTRPRLYNILGVEFALGSVTSTKRMRIKLPPAHELEPQEREALDLIAMLRSRAAHTGIDLPASADFQFLRTVLDFNVRLFIPARDELMGLAGHAETSGQFLVERFKAIDETLNNILSDILALMVFTRHGDASFSFEVFYALCVGAARDPSAIGSSRPFVTHEIARRPRELAYQLREVLRRKLHIDVVLASVDKLLDCWRVMGRNRFATELDAAITVIDAFPMVFAGDSEEAAFITVGRIVRDALVSEAPDRADCLIRVAQAYDHIGRKVAAIA